MSEITLTNLYVGNLVRPGAVEFLYELMKERDPEINISHSTLPTFEQHQAFVERQPYRLWYLIDHKEEGWVGYVSATERNEIGIVLKKSARGRGFGPRALQLFIADNHPLASAPSQRNGRWLANIAPTNPHSRHVFEKLGFRKIQETFALGGG